jgi:hypothetical protein
MIPTMRTPFFLLALLARAATGSAGDGVSPGQADVARFDVDPFDGVLGKWDGCWERNPYFINQLGNEISPSWRRGAGVRLR